MALVSLGCARNEVDSEELAGRLDAAGWRLVPTPEQADVTLVNTCGFIEAAKQDSIDTLLEVAQRKPAHGKVVAVGCLAQRYGRDLAEALPEAAAVLSFDDYSGIDLRLRQVMAGQQLPAHTPGDRRRQLPLSPISRPLVAQTTPTPLRPNQPGVVHRRRLGTGPSAPLKLASGCDRRCAFCAIPTFRGAFVSRPSQEVLAEAHQLAQQGVRELVLVSENTTSYGKDLGDMRLLEALLPQLTAVEGVQWVRLNYLQPAEMRPSLIDAMTQTPGVVPYFDLSFQHASARVLRRMRRFGDTDRFLELLAQIRAQAPQAGVRTNVIVGFPGESSADVQELERFLNLANLDAVGVFGYSDEEGTEAEGLADHLPQQDIDDRVEHLASLVEHLSEQRAAQRVGQQVHVLVESLEPDAGQPLHTPPQQAQGRCAHQGPQTDGGTTLRLTPGSTVSIGDVVPAQVVDSEGVDLWAQAQPEQDRRI